MTSCLLVLIRTSSAFRPVLEITLGTILIMYQWLCARLRVVTCGFPSRYKDTIPHDQASGLRLRHFPIFPTTPEMRLLWEKLVRGTSESLLYRVRRFRTNSGNSESVISDDNNGDLVASVRPGM